MLCLKIICGTKLIIERAEKGDTNVPGHTCILFIDLFRLFLEIVNIVEIEEYDEKEKIY